MAFKSLLKSLLDTIFRYCERLFLCGPEIEPVNSTAMWAWMTLGATTREHDLKILMALRACDLLSDRKVPFHNLCSLLPSTANCVELFDI